MVADFPTSQRPNAFRAQSAGIVPHVVYGV
jgi:hypothetical protein